MPIDVAAKVVYALALMKLSTDKLTAARVKLGYSQADCARACGMTPQQWHNVESGQRADPRISTIARMSKVIKAPLDDLLEDEEVTKRPRGRRRAKV
jgi:transcriptional regulator with XRE-family HTH domain